MGNKVKIVCMGIAILILGMYSPMATAMTPEEMMGFVPSHEQHFVTWTWDTPTRWAEIRKSSDGGVFTQEEMDILCQGSPVVGTDVDESAKFKAAYPDVLYTTGYMNLEKDTRSNGLTGHFLENPEHYLYETNGDPLVGGDCPWFNLANPDTREYWLDEAAEQIARHENDGWYFFVDALAKVGVVDGSDYEDYWGNPVGDNYFDHARTLMAELRDQFADKVLIAGNFARPGTGSVRTEFTMDYTHIAYIESFENFGDYVPHAHDAIALMQQLAAEGKRLFITVNAYNKPIPMTEPTLAEKRAKAEAAMPDIWAEYTETERDELAEIYAYFPFKLAMFLMGAGEKSHFKYTGSKVVRTSGRDLFKNIMPFPEWDMPLGEPLELAQRDGDVYTRRFEHVEVVLDLANGTCQFNEWSGDNLALSGTATQSSTDYSGVPERAIDNNTNGAWSGGSVTHTETEAQPWWEVDLGDSYNIDEIRIWNRTDSCCQDRLSDYDVAIFDSDSQLVWSDYQAGYPDPMVSLNPIGTTGQYVLVQLRGTNALNLAEVQVYGEGIHPCEFPWTDDDFTISNANVSYSSGVIDISCVSSVDISMDLEGVGSMEDDDYLNVYYTVDDGSPIAISLNINAFALKSVSATGITGTTLEILIDGATSAAGESYYVTNMTITEGGDDTDPPLPDPAEWASVPTALTSSAIAMTATTGSDPSGPVEYYFAETSGNPGGSDSDWQTSSSYTDSGLASDTTYTYTVTMRDSADNTGGASNPASATTPPEGGCNLPWTEDDFTISDEIVNYSSGSIDISCASSVDISMDLEGVGNMETSDYLNVYYAVDGESPIAISLNTDSFTLKTVTATGISGGSVEILIDGATSVATETYYVSNMSVSEGGGNPNIRGEWTFDNVSSTVVYDSSAYGHDGTRIGGTIVTGNTGDAMEFDGVDNSVTLPAAAFSTISDEVTVALWVNGDAIQPVQDVLFRAVDASGNRVLNIHLPWSNSRVYWDAGNNGTSSYDRIYATASASQFEGQWNHWVFVKDATSGDMTIYVNGSEFHSGSGKTQTMSGITSAALGSGIGADWYTGAIDEVILYDVALSASEVSDLYNSY